MPELEITFTEQDAEILERVRQQQGLASIQQAAEWLVKRRLRLAHVASPDETGRSTSSITTAVIDAAISDRKSR